MMTAKTKDGPDRGWSWVVAFAACFNSLILAGIFRTGGVLFVAFISYYGVSREEASWPMVLCISVLNLTGPFAGILAEKYGVRPVTIAGALIGTIGISGCYFTTSLGVITILFGVIFGIGYGLVNTLMPVIVNVYFLELRATANGIANSGSCFGSLILPVFFEFLIETYGLTGCFLMTGGVVLHVAVSGALLRPPSWLTATTVNEETSKHVEVPRDYNTSPRSAAHQYQNSENSGHAESHNNISSDDSSSKFGDHSFLDPDSAEQRSLLSELNVTLRHRNKTHKHQASKVKESGISSQTPLDKNEDELLQSYEDFEKMLVKLSSTDGQTSEDDIINNTACSEHENFIPSNSPNNHNVFSYSGNTHSLMQINNDEQVYQKAAHAPTNQSLNHNNIHPPSSEIQKLAKHEESKQVSCCCECQTINSCPVAFRSFYAVLGSPLFYVTAITNVSFYFLFHMYVVIIIDYSLDVGVPSSNGKFILFAFAISDLFGRLCLGWITDRNYLRRTHFVMGGMVAIGVVFFCFPFARSYASLVTVSCCYGLLLGCTMVVFPILLVDFLGTERIAVAYGCMCFLNGFASFGRPFLIGYFRDNLGSYANIFNICGIISICASLLWLLEKCFLKRPQVDISSV